MNEWNSIDLHMHTISGFTRDKTKDVVNFSYFNFRKAIINYNIKLMAVTNHNHISIVQYILIRHLAKMNDTNVLMGVELDSNLLMGTPIHIACIFNDNFLNNYDAMLDITNQVKSKLNNTEIYFTDTEIVDLLSKYDVLLIPHGNKDKGVFKNASSQQILEALKKIREGFIRIFDSPSDWKLVKIKNYLNSINENNLDVFGGVLFSDTRDWNKYDQNYRKFYMNAEPTFKGLIHSTSNPTKRFKHKEEIETNNNYIKKIVFRNANVNSRIVENEIMFSSDYNCIIGKSGTGKSLLVHLITNKLQRNNIENQNYSFANNTIVEIYNEKNQILNPENINIGIGAPLFDKIITATSTKDNSDYYSIINLLSSDFQKKEKFLDFKKSYGDNIKEYCLLEEQIKKVKENLLILINKYNSDNSKFLSLKNIKTFDVPTIVNSNIKTYTEEDLNIITSYLQKINDLKDVAKPYKGKIKNDLLESIKKLQKYFEYASLDMSTKHLCEKVIDNKISIINKAILKINKTKSTQAEEKSKLLASLPIDRNKIVNNILYIYKNIKKVESIDLTVSKLQYNSETIISSEANVVVKETIDEEIFSNVNEKENLIFNTYGKKGMLSKDNNYNLKKQGEAKKLLDKYIAMNIINSSTDPISSNLDVKIEVLFDNQNIEKLNPGSIAKKYIELYFNEQVNSGKKNTVIFDQIENDVDKEFISDVIRELIEGTKGKVQLIVVTHDPIVAVNADPNNYIETSKIGDKINYRNFVAESTIKDELNTIACTVDGSKEVIKNRYEIYKGDKEYGN